VVLHHHTNVGRAREPGAGGTVGVEVNQCDGLTLAAEISGQVGGNRAFANATFLTGDQNFECRHLFSSVLMKQHSTSFCFRNPKFLAGNGIYMGVEPLVNALLTA
jgi:hypothetical protein